MKSLTKPELDELVAGLHRLARNLWWTWDQEAQEIFGELSPRGWQNLFHNAVAILHEVSNYELRVRLQDGVLADRVRRVLASFDAYLNEAPTWGDEHAPSLVEHPVAYFSAEFGFHETLPIAAGGLGILAGDHAKSASDLDIGFVGISLFYREGYFQQSVDANNWQMEYYDRLNPDNIPLEPVLDLHGNTLVCEVDIAMSKVRFKAWRVNVGRVPVYLIDANLPENEQMHRDLTLHVYGGDTNTRIMQEMLLGIGGVKLLRALDVYPSVFHMNEGHAAFLTLELMREKLSRGTTFEDALTRTKAECVFTTHTPVEAGHDRFNKELVDFAMHKFLAKIPASFDKVMALGRVNPAVEAEPFCMTVLALKLSRSANAVSELHGQVSREMWQCLYPGCEIENVPIGHITNGVHTLGWLKGPVRKFWRRKLSGENSRHAVTKGLDQEAAFYQLKAKSSWKKLLNRTEFWENVAGEDTTFWQLKSKSTWKTLLNTREFWENVADPGFISDEEIWSLRYQLRRELLEFTRRRLLLQHQRLAHGDFIRFDSLLNNDALTIGFARRFATYKRAPLIFQQFEKIVRLARDAKRPIQFVFAGKAHPRDDAGKRFIQHIIHLSKYSDLQGHLVFIENYDVHIARTMVSGCDVWLNNPRRPLEASGTSGMKAAANGCLNFSILDGWWREAYDGNNGFAIGQDSHSNDVEEQDRVDSENLFKTLTEEVIPCFYDRDELGVPRKWIAKIRHAFVTIVPQFSTGRMVQDYTEKYYVPE